MSLSVSELLQLPHRRVVSQGSVVTAETGQVVVLVWLLDLHGDPSTTVRPASMVQGYLHEWLGVCARREQEAPPAPPPPPPSAPPSPLPPTTARSPPPYWLRTYTTGLTSMNSGVGAPLHAIASDGSVSVAVRANANDGRLGRTSEACGRHGGNRQVRAVHLAAAAAKPDSAAARRVASANSVASDLFVDCEWRTAGD